MAEIPNNQLGCMQPVVNNGINYLTGERRISAINSTFGWFRMMRHHRPPWESDESGNIWEPQEDGSVLISAINSRIDKKKL